MAGASFGRVPISAALLASLLPLAGASAGGESPPPVVAGAPSPATKTIDELLAVVEGEVVTRRRIVRDLGERAADEDEEVYERKVRLALLKRARTLVVVKAAKRMGLSLPPDLLDRYALDEGRRAVAEAKKRAEKEVPGSGDSITFEKLLASRQQTLEEFRAERADEALVQNYFSILVRGVAGKRPVLDLEPSPEEVRTLWLANRAGFDQRAAIRFAVVSVSVSAQMPEGSGRSFEEALARAKASLQALVADRRAGTSFPDAIRSRGAVGIDWTESEKWTEKPVQGVVFRGEGVDAWAFDPARRSGDLRELEGKDGAPLVLLVLETRPARSRSFEDVRDEVADFVRRVRSVRFVLAHTLELLSRASVTPQRVVDDLTDQVREESKDLDRDEVARSIRLR